jgi:hypothetical protein
MTDTTTLDAAIEAAYQKMWPTSFYVNITDSSRTYARALIAKLLEGMDGMKNHKEAAGYDAALTEIRRRAGLEVES